MSNRYSVGQMNQLGDGLEAADFSVDDVTKLRNPDLLMQVKLVLMGIATVVRACLKLALTKALDPSFINKDWKVWKGSADGNGLEGDEDRDVREDALNVVDFEQLILETNLQGEETVVNGEEKLLRLKAGRNIRLGGKALLALWEDYQARKAEGKPEESVLEKLHESKKVTCIYFFGLVLRRPNGNRLVLCLSFFGSEWYWGYCWLGGGWNSSGPSASLASVEVQSLSALTL